MRFNHITLLRDPDGHELRLYSEASDYRLNPPWKLREPEAAG